MAKGDFVLTVPQIKQAAQLYRLGLSRRQVAAHFGVSDTAAGNALRLAGVRMRERRAAATLALSKGPQKHLTT